MFGILVSLLFIGHPAAHASAAVRSDCSARELKTLRNSALVHKALPNSTLLHEDCTILKDKDEPMLLVLYVLNGMDGKEARLAVFKQKDFTPKSRALFISENLGTEALPILAKGSRRLIFALPQKKQGKIVFYANLVNATDGGHFQKFELKVRAKKLVAVEGHSWLVGRSKVPKIYLEKDKWKGIVNQQLVDL